MATLDDKSSFMKWKECLAILNSLVAEWEDDAKRSKSYTTRLHRRFCATQLKNTLERIEAHVAKIQYVEVK